jgi:hypothetical protein
MSTKLDRLLESIDPSCTLDRVSADVDRAVNSFIIGRTTIEDWNEYEKFLADFCQYVETTVFKIGASVPEYREFYWSRCVNIINNEFGPSGPKTAFEMVRTGKEGGLYKILKIIANQMTEKYAQNEISARISNYWNHLTIDEQMAATDEYLSKFGHLLPTEFTDGSAVRLKVHFTKVLNEHPKMIRRMRQIVR